MTARTATWISSCRLPALHAEQIGEVCGLLEGKRVHANSELWIFTPRQTKELADQQGYTKIIEEAGAHLMSDTCSALGRVIPKGAKVAAADSAKQSHYLPAIMGIECWLVLPGPRPRAPLRWRGPGMTTIVLRGRKVVGGR